MIEGEQFSVSIADVAPPHASFVADQALQTFAWDARDQPWYRAVEIRMVNGRAFRRVAFDLGTTPEAAEALVDEGVMQLNQRSLPPFRRMVGNLVRQQVRTAAYAPEDLGRVLDFMPPDERRLAIARYREGFEQIGKLEPQQETRLARRFMWETEAPDPRPERQPHRQKRDIDTLARLLPYVDEAMMVRLAVRHARRAAQDVSPPRLGAAFKQLPPSICQPLAESLSARTLQHYYQHQLVLQRCGIYLPGVPRLLETRPKETRYGFQHAMRLFAPRLNVVDVAVLAEFMGSQTDPGPQAYAELASEVLADPEREEALLPEWSPSKPIPPPPRAKRAPKPKPEPRPRARTKPRPRPASPKEPTPPPERYVPPPPPELRLTRVLGRFAAHHAPIMDGRDTVLNSVERAALARHMDNWPLDKIANDLELDSESETGKLIDKVLQTLVKHLGESGLAALEKADAKRTSVPAPVESN